MLRERLALPGSKNACEQGECGSCSVYLDGALVCSCLVAAGQAEGRDGGDRRRAGRRGRAAPDPGGVPGGGRRAVRVLHAGPDRRHARPAGAQSVARATPRSARRWPATCAAARATRRSSTRCGWRRSRADLIEGCAVATVAGAVHRDGHIVDRGQPDHRRRRPARRAAAKAARIDASGCLATPGLINCHHHLYQWATRGLRAAGDAVRVAGRAVPDVGADRRAGRARGGARGARGAAARRAARRRPTTTTSSPGGDLLAVEIEAARELGIRFHPCRGAMDLGVSHGGLPPDSVVEDRDAILAAYEDALNRFHDPAPGSMCRIALAPCSPFSVTQRADGRDGGVRPRSAACGCTRTWPRPSRRRRSASSCSACGRSSTSRSSAGSATTSGSRTACTCTSARSRGSARRGTGVAHCPSSNARLGAGIAPVVPLVRAGAPVGLGVDGAASNEAGELGGELRQALLVARLRGGPAAMTVRGGAGARHAARRALPRPRRRARHAGGRQARRRRAVAARRPRPRRASTDPVAALVLGPRPLARHGDRRRRGRGPGRRAADGRRGGDRAASWRRWRCDEHDHDGPRRRRRSPSAGRTASRRSRASSPTRRTCGPRTCCGARRCAPRTRGRASARSRSARRWRSRACTPCSPTRTCPGARPTGSSTTTSRCWRSPRSAIRASRWRSSPPTIPRPRAAPPTGSRSTTRSSSRSSIPSTRCRPDSPPLHPGGNLLRHVHIAHGDGAGRGRRRGHRRVRGRDAGPGLPRAGVRARDAGRGRRRRPVHRDPVAARRPRPGRGVAWTCRSEKVRFTLAGVGGAFGGREDVSMQIHACLLALHTGRPVKMVYGREESFFGHVHRHPARMRYEHGATRDGKLALHQVRGSCSTAARTRPPRARSCSNAASFALGPYEVPSARIDSYVVYTDNPPCGAMRGFGAVQTCFAHEAQMDKLAAALDMDPVELRLRNAMATGTSMPTGAPINCPAPVAELLRAGARRGRCPTAAAASRAGSRTSPAARASCAASATPSASRTSASPRVSTTSRRRACGSRRPEVNL